jgi:hypothetical protein
MIYSIQIQEQLRENNKDTYPTEIITEINYLEDLHSDQRRK